LFGIGFRVRREFGEQMGCLWYDLMKAVKGNSAMMEALLDAIPKKVDNTTGTGHEHDLYTLPPYL